MAQNTIVLLDAGQGCWEIRQRQTMEVVATVHRSSLMGFVLQDAAGVSIGEVYNLPDALTRVEAYLAATEVAAERLAAGELAESA